MIRTGRIQQTPDKAQEKARVAGAGTHGATVELIAIIIALDVLRRRDEDEPAVEPTSPHPGRSCDQTCDVTNDAHDGCVWSAS